LFEPGAPLVVLSRHGGPGDSFILIHTLLNRAHRMPRIVLKNTMQWDPVVDVLLHRVPARFITPTGFGTQTRGGGGAVSEQIGDLAGGMSEADAVVIFPEGGQATARRRISRIERYRSRGLDDLAARTESLRHVMPPQPGGVHAALQAAPTADVVFIAHTGLEKLASVGDVWRELPMDKHITMRAVRVPRRLIPDGRAEQAEWLFDWFEGIDAWIDDQG
ncbi:MAG TPA: 1-acyl-sn-glycerol-3-phosphate acyltransferase, partial [Microbacterium sp.]|nr:1-acyl-sn-glycerol-3-phosphate acyltransferase [Microbacterium sp.]